MLTSLISIIEGLLVIVPALLSVAFVTIAERKTMSSMQRRLGPNVVGYLGLLQAFADALKLLLKEYVAPTQANIILFFLGPVITLIFSLLGYLVIPFGSGLFISDYSLGLLYMLAVGSISGYGILLAGWSANSKYAFLGSLRSTAQLISYELVLGSVILIVLLLTGSFNIITIIESQRVVNLLFPLFPLFIVFFISSIAETNRPPFDLAEANPLTNLGKIKLNPYWITGFTDAEGSFIVKIIKVSDYKLGWRIQLSFQIKLNNRDHELLTLIRDYFGVGTIRKYKGNFSIYSVTKVDDLVSVIFPHFDQYPLLTKKWADYELFKAIVFIMADKKHNTEEGFLKILGLRYYLNLGISEELKLLYPNIIPVDRPIVPEININNDWLVGFIDGEGCFYINVIKSNTNYKVWLLFQISQHNRDTNLMEKIALYLNCGSVKQRGKGLEAVDFEVTKFELIYDQIIPFLLANPLKSSKLHDFYLFYDATEIINKKKTRQWGINDIDNLLIIKKKMNKYL